MKPKSEIKIQDRTIGIDHPTYFIADIAANHDGDLERAKQLIFLAAEAGADAAKFQHFKASTIVSNYGFKSLGGQKSHQAEWEKSVYEVYEDASLNVDWTPILKETCNEAGIHFFTSPYSLELVNAVDEYVPAYKMGSGDITWIEIIRHMAKKDKPMILSSGASTLDDVVRAVEACLEINPATILMQCNTNYTAKPENFKYINLRVLQTYADMYPNLILGLSDHTHGHSTVLGAVTLGARVVEKHFTDDTSREGPDHTFSMTPETWSEMVERTREIEYALGSGVKRIEENEKETVIVQRRSIRAKDDIAEGEIIEKDDLEVLRPCPKNGIPPYKMDQIVGKKAVANIKSGDHIRWELITSR